ncbi:hypothetical protein EI019_20490 [Escherichia coli]|nr:hypothetical protein [Escherichia coli]RCA60220.1 hypothetical protein C6A39_24325 [Escherichia coli]
MNIHGLFLLFNKYKYILIMHPAAGHYFSISGYSKFCCFIREYLYDTSVSYRCYCCVSRNLGWWHMVHRYANSAWCRKIY